MVFKRPFRAKTSRYGPHELGYRRATKNFYKVMQNFILKILYEFYIWKNIFISFYFNFIKFKGKERANH